MRTRSRALTLGLLAVLAGCGRPADLAPVAPPPAAPAGDLTAEQSAQGYHIQQLGGPRWRDYLLRRRIALAVESAVFTMVNQERANAGLAPLTHATALRNVARLHSIDMAAKSYFAHNAPDGKTPANRLTDANIAFSAWAENIRWVSAPRTNAANDIMYEAGTGWMNSPGHRANILNPNLTQVGVGVYLNPARTRYYATQVFIRP
ncbi:MAG: CAP domain-containing protein [Candidatus Sericytochromatia bacterium]